jgi:hypothetical protein
MARRKPIAGLLVCIMLHLLVTDASAQKLIFEDSSFISSDHLKFGPNLNHYFHPFFSTSATLPLIKETTILTKLPFTGQLSIGYRYKYKLTQRISLILESGFDRSFFQLNEPKGLLNSDTLPHHSQTIQTLDLFGGALIRLRFGQPGNYLGQFLDFGFVGQANILASLITKDKIASEGLKSWSSDITTRTNSKVLEPFSYSACLRLGFNRLSFTANYRISKLLNTLVDKDLPTFQLGMEMSIVRY